MELPHLVAAGFLGIEHFTPPWDVFFLPLFNLLVLLYRILFSDFALAIIVFTIVVRTVLAPLFVRQIRSAKEMQAVAPLIREVQRKHKGNRQKILEEQQALYREHGINPAGGCLPIVVQLPILFALYQALIRASSTINFTPNDAQRGPLAEYVSRVGIEPLANNNYRVPISGPCDAPPDFASLVPLNCQLVDPLKLDQPVDTTIGWLANLNLADIDRVFSFAIGGDTGFHLSALAVLAAILQFVQVKMTSPRPNPDDPSSSITNTMIYTFPLLTIVWGGWFPSGLILYWVVYTAYLTVHQYFIMGWGNLFPLFGWQPGFAPRPESGIVPPPRRRDADPDTGGGSKPLPPGTRPGPAGSRGNPRPANRRSRGAKRRGRRR